MTVERLYTPWRMKYVTAPNSQKLDCVFCAKLEDGPEHDAENYVVYRGRTAFVVMNIFPYNTGHLMILPYDHVAVLTEISLEVQAEMMFLTTYFTELLSQLMHPDGFNTGMNIGKAAGAGIVGHLHLHIVPRWSGDSNFMSVVGETRVLPEMLDDTYHRIIDFLEKHPPEIPTLQIKARP